MRYSSFRAGRLIRYYLLYHIRDGLRAKSGCLRAKSAAPPSRGSTFFPCAPGMKMTVSGGIPVFDLHLPLFTV
jgi:hypothetical protein